MISLHAMDLYHTEGRAGRMTAFVVVDAHRRAVVGRTLAETADANFIANSCVRAEATSGDYRDAAHAICAAQGFAGDERRFVKRYDAARKGAGCPNLPLAGPDARDKCLRRDIHSRNCAMNTTRFTHSTAGAALLVAAGFAPIAASATTIFDDRPILVRPAPHISRGDCPTCYKGHDFGSDCFQFVWNGFEQTWTNVCLLGWH